MSVGRRPVAAATLALTLASCGDSQGPVARAGHERAALPPTRVTFKLKGGSGHRFERCSVSHDDRVYTRGSPVGFAGVVTPIPGGHWKAKVRLKRCQAGTYVFVTEVAATKDKRSGTFRGQFAPQARGLYAARASVSAGGATIAKSRKRHFEVR